MQANNSAANDLNDILDFLAKCVVGKYEQPPGLPEHDDEVAELNIGLKLLAETLDLTEKNISQLKDRIYLMEETIKQKQSEASELEAGIDKCYAELEKLKQQLPNGNINNSTNG